MGICMDRPPPDSSTKSTVSSMNSVGNTETIIPKSLNCPIILEQGTAYNKANLKVDVEASIRNNNDHLFLVKQFNDEKKKESLKKTVLEIIKSGTKMYPSGMLYRDIMDLLKSSYKIPDNFQFRLIMDACLAQLVSDGVLEKKCTVFKLKENSSQIKDEIVKILRKHQPSQRKFHEVNKTQTTTNGNNSRQKFLPQIREVTPRPLIPTAKPKSNQSKNHDDEIRKLCLSRNLAGLTTILVRNETFHPILPNFIRTNSTQENSPPPIVPRDFYTVDLSDLEPLPQAEESSTSTPEFEQDNDEDDEDMLNDVYEE